MRGEGWECENCGTKVVVPCPNGYMSHNNYPDGWFIMVGPKPSDGSYANPENHFCSWKCVEDYAYIQRKQNEQ